MRYEEPPRVRRRSPDEPATRPGRVPVHPLLWSMAIAFLAIEGVQQLADADLVPFDRWTVMTRFAFWDVLFARAVEGGAVTGQLVASTVTYAFLHADWLHVGLNTAAFLGLGHAITQAIGAARLLASFVITAVAGAIAFGLIADIPNPLVGASGSVFGFLGMITAWQERALARRGASRMPIWQRLIGLAAINAALDIGLSGLLAWEAHLGGFVAGWLLALLWRPARRVSLPI